MSRSKDLREVSETNQSPRNAPRSRAADICDSLRRKEERLRRTGTGLRASLLSPAEPRPREFPKPGT
jgi:hypothetical protein